MIGNYIETEASRIYHEAERKGFVKGEAKGEARGITIGEARGITIGESSRMIHNVKRMYDKSYPLDEIADIQEISVDEVEKILGLKPVER